MKCKGQMSHLVAGMHVCLVSVDNTEIGRNINYIGLHRMQEVTLVRNCGKFVLEISPLSAIVTAIIM
jgi:hypothetical protein